MIKALILISLIFFSFELDHCDYVVKTCKKCIDGYKFYNSIYGPYCEKEEDSSNSGNIEHCLFSNGNECNSCEKGYAKTKEGKCRENTIHCDLFDGDTCIECENYYKLTEGRCEKSSCVYFQGNKCECYHGYYNKDKGGCSKIPIKFCQKGNATYCEECEREYFLTNKGECSKIPIKFCQKGNDTYCEECYWKYEFNQKAKECALREGEEEEEYNTPTGGNIENCGKVNNEDKTICDECMDNYDWDSKTKKCIYLCVGETEELCDECKENYYSYDYGKTCEKIDPDYSSSDEEGENGANFMKFYFAILGALLFLVV